MSHVERAAGEWRVLVAVESRFVPHDLRGEHSLVSPALLPAAGHFKRRVCFRHQCFSTGADVDSFMTRPSYAQKPKCTSASAPHSHVRNISMTTRQDAGDRFGHTTAQNQNHIPQISRECRADLSTVGLGCN